MGLLSKLKSVLGLGSGDDDRGGRRSGDVGVTVERERDETDAANEAAVKGVDEETKGSTVEGTDATPGPGSDAGPEAENGPEDDADVDAGTDGDTDHEGDAEAKAGTNDDETGTADAEAGAEDGGDGADDAGGDLQDIKGIGPAYADRLSEVGIESIGELADADFEAVAEEADLAPGRVDQWVNRAKARQ